MILGFTTISGYTYGGMHLPGQNAASTLHMKKDRKLSAKK